MLEHQRIKDRIIEIICKNIKTKHCKIFFFGSRVNGQASERSDIDIGVEADILIPQKTIREIKDELEGIQTLNKFDLVDFKSVDAEFKQAANKNIEVIYER
jgi:predicted nucleotidyltransferase